MCTIQPSTAFYLPQYLHGCSIPHNWTWLLTDRLHKPHTALPPPEAPTTPHIESEIPAVNVRIHFLQKWFSFEIPQQTRPSSRQDAFSLQWLSPPHTHTPSCMLGHCFSGNVKTPSLGGPREHLLPPTGDCTNQG